MPLFHENSSSIIDFLQGKTKKIQKIQEKNLKKILSENSYLKKNRIMKNKVTFNEKFQKYALPHLQFLKKNFLFQRVGKFLFEKISAAFS